MKVAALTWLKSDDIFLKTWMDYYSQWFPLHIVNYSNCEFEGYGHEFTQYKKEELTPDETGGLTDFYKTLIYMCKKTFTNLLKTHDYVVFSDLDEIIIVDSSNYKDLGDYMQKMDREQVICSGRQVLQNKDDKTHVDFNAPLLPQRGLWWPHIAHFKTGISRTPLNWVSGFHYTEDQAKLTRDNGTTIPALVKKECDKNLVMCHLKSIDRDIFEWRSGRDYDAEFSLHGRDCEEIPSSFMNQV